MALLIGCDGIALIGPGAQATQERHSVGIAHFLQVERRTGAGFFGRSGAVEDDGAGNGQLCTQRFNFVEGHENAAGNVRGSK